MSFLGMLDSVCDVYRDLNYGGGTVDADGNTLPNWDLVDTDQPVHVWRPPRRNRDIGAGEAEVGEFAGGMLAAANVAQGDVLHMKAGPEEGRWYRILVDPFKPRNHHTELELERYHGRPPEVVS